jgi:hypothetical protein
MTAKGNVLSLGFGLVWHTWDVADHWLFMGIDRAIVGVHSWGTGFAIVGIVGVHSWNFDFGVHSGDFDHSHRGLGCWDRIHAAEHWGLGWCGRIHSWDFTVHSCDIHSCDFGIVARHWGPGWHGGIHSWGLAVHSCEFDIGFIIGIIYCAIRVVLV